MTEVIFNENGILSLGAVSREEDLNTQARIIINGPPGDGCCNVCGKHMSELTPFGGPGDPLVGDFTSELLIKKFRPDDFDDDHVAISVSKSWECRDCAVSDEDEYFEKLRARQWI